MQRIDFRTLGMFDELFDDPTGHIPKNEVSRPSLEALITAGVIRTIAGFD